MNKIQKQEEVKSLNQQIKDSFCFYLTDTSELTVAEINAVRRKCFEKGISLRVAKNTLIKRALQDVDGNFDELLGSLKGPTSIMFAEAGNAPAKLIKELRKQYSKPVLKAAFIDDAVYIGDDSLDALSNLKSKQELVADIIALLQSPAKNVISALKSGENKLSGIVKTLSDRPE